MDLRDDPLDETIRSSRNLVSQAEAFERIHRPTSIDQVDPARDRFRYEEAFVLQTILGLRRRAAANSPATARTGRVGGLADAIAQRLPFPLTAGQQNALEDIRGDLDGSNVQDGVPMTLRVRVVDTASSCKAVAGAAVYVWHCNKDGVYSAYNSPMNGGDESARSYLRGVQVTDANGDVTFRTILPGRYQGRAFHIHFEVYRGAEPTGSAKVLTSQMAADDAFIDQLYASVGYSAAARNVTHNGEDNVFSDGVDTQLLTLTGDPPNWIQLDMDSPAVVVRLFSMNVMLLAFNLVPESEYHRTLMQAWNPRHLRAVEAFIAVLGQLWPWLALVYCMRRLLQAHQARGR